MIFSTLVDADYIETERFYAEHEGRAIERGDQTSLAALRSALDAHLATKIEDAPATPLNELRAKILSYVRAGAERARGVFTLTVPTGGGKTLKNMRAVFVEYAWDMGWCDPCAADPLSNKELVELGARWIGSDDAKPFRGQGGSAYVTRLHVRYDAKSFPEDLALMETGDRSNFQGRYILHHPWQGKASCDAGEKYRESLPARFRQEAHNLASLTGWSQAEIESRMEVGGQSLRGSE